MTTRIKIAQNTTDVRVCFVNGRAVSTIIKQEDGKYRVVKMYDGYVKDCDSYSEAREEAVTAGVQTPPRQTVKSTSNVTTLKAAAS